MATKCKIISCGKINKKIISLIIGGIFYAMTLFFEDSSKIFSPTNPHPIVYTLIYSVGLCLSFIFYVVYRIKNRRKESINSLITEQNSYESNFNLHVVSKTISKKEKYLWILLVSVIDYISFAINSSFWISSDNYITNWGTNFISFALFSYFILKVKLYKHHFISIGIIIIIGLLYNIPLGLYNADNIKKYYDAYLSYTLTGISFSLTYVIYKYMMIKKYIKFYEILFFEGVIESFLGILTLIIATACDSLDNFFDFTKKLDTTETLIVILLLISRFLFHSTVIIVIDFYSPFYVFLLFIIGEGIVFFATISEKEFGDIILGFILLFFLIFTILVFLELIELNFFGLSKMTKKNIELRARLDSSNEETDFEDEKIIAYKGYEFKLNPEESKGTQELVSINENSNNEDYEYKNE